MMQQTESADLAVRDLTARQRNIVQVIEDSVQRYGYAPTLREIGEAVGLASTSSVSHQLSRLEKKGYLSRDAGRPRTAVVLPMADPATGPTGAPIMRTVTSGGSGSPGYRWSAVSRRAARSSRTSRSRTSSRCPGNSSARETSSCSGSSATR